MQQRSRQRLTQRNRFSWNRAGVTLPSLTAVRSITERPLRGHSAAAKRNRRLAREIPLLPIHIDQRYRALHAKRPILTDIFLINLFVCVFDSQRNRDQNSLNDIRPFPSYKTIMVRYYPRAEDCLSKICQCIVFFLLERNQEVTDSEQRSRLAGERRFPAKRVSDPKF